MHRLPVEVVVPDLRGVFEDRAFGRADDPLEALLLLGLSRDQLLELADVSAVMLLVVDRNGLPPDVRLERVRGVGQRSESQVLHGIGKKQPACQLAVRAARMAFCETIVSL